MTGTRAVTAAPRTALEEGAVGRSEVIYTLHRLALMNPREPARVEEEVLAELRRAPEHAARAYYAIEYGGKNPTTVTGLSIRAAEALARAWGNCLASVQRTNETEDEVEMTGRIIILEPRIACFERPVRMSKRQKRKGKKGQGDYWMTLQGEKLDQATQSCASKAMRNAILAALPDGLKQRYFEEARRIVQAEQENPEKGKPKNQRKAAFLDRMSGAVAKFRDAYSIEKRILEGFVGKAFDEWTAADAAKLTGLWNALEDGMQTPEDLIEEIDPPEPRREAASQALQDRARKHSQRRSPQEGPRCGGCGKELTPQNSVMTEAGWRCSACATERDDGPDDEEWGPPTPEPEEEQIDREEAKESLFDEGGPKSAADKLRGRAF